MTTVASKGPDVKEVKDLLEEENENTNHVAIADNAAALRSEEMSETATGSSLLPPRATGDVVRAEKKTDKAAVRPPTYEVQEGDTLYKIAVRFYGSIRAWRMIRDANKTLISTDGRVQAGQTIRLP